jgi:peptidyl-prolyl cis-trans isomerase D
MLAQLRKSARNIISSLIIGVLVLAFAIWGVHDVFSGMSGASYVAKVGSETISPRQLSRELDLFLRGQRQQNHNVTQQEAIAQGVHQRLLNSMMMRLAFTQYAEKLGVSASNARVAAALEKIPDARSPITGRIDRGAYAQFLRDYGYGQEEFEQELRGEITGAMLRQSLVAGVRAPASFGALVLAFQSERRTVSIAELPASLAGQIPAPDDSQIQALYEDSAAQFSVPEYRAITLVIARPSDFAARVDVPEARIREEFDSHRASFDVPEKRSFVVLSATDQAKAADAARRLGAGEDPAHVASALGLQLISYDAKARSEVADSAVAATVFGMAAGAAPEAVRGAVTPWAAVKLSGITPAQSVSYESQRQHIRDEIALSEGGDLQNEAISAFEDARSAGTPAAEAARTAGLAVVQIPAVNAEGKDRDNADVAAFTGQAELLHTAFATPEGESSDFIPGPDSADVVVSVDQVTPASTRPLTEVRDQVIGAYYARERVRRMRDLGNDAAAALRQGANFAAIARAHHMAVVVTSRPVDRRAASQFPAQRLGAEIFGAAVGDVVMDLRVDGGALIVAKVEAVNRADPAQSAQEIEQFRTQMQQTLAESLDEAAADEIFKATPHKINTRLLTQLYPANGEDQEGQ